MSNEKSVMITLPSFEEVMRVTSGVSGNAAFELEECECYYRYLSKLTKDSKIVEIGLQFGRSSSIVMQLQKYIGFGYWGIDPFTDPPDAREQFVHLVSKLGAWFILIDKRTQDMAPNTLPQKIDLTLVDGDHTAEGVEIDCWYAMPRTVVGGHILFHDYGRESLPDIHPTVNRCMTDDWQEVEVVGTLGVWRRIR